MIDVNIIVTSVLSLVFRRLTLKHSRTLQLEEDVLCVKFSPDHRLLAVSLLDCTVKIFYTDTLKVHIQPHYFYFFY